MATKTRDAERSRAAILDAAERRFAEHGYGGASLGDIAADAGLSRGTPSYFFGSKEQLYTAVLERVFAARERATRAAFAPLVEWARRGGERPAKGGGERLAEGGGERSAEGGGGRSAEGGGERGSLEDALRGAVADYLRFLADRPTFVRLLMWEGLGDGARLANAPRESRAMADAFGALGAVAPARGVKPFDVDDAVLLFVSLTFSPLTQRTTLLARLHRGVGEAARRRRQIDLAVAQLTALVRA